MIWGKKATGERKTLIKELDELRKENRKLKKLVKQTKYKVEFKIFRLTPLTDYDKEDIKEYIEEWPDDEIITDFKITKLKKKKELSNKK